MCRRRGLRSAGPVLSQTRAFLKRGVLLRNFDQPRLPVACTASLDCSLKNPAARLIPWREPVKSQQGGLRMLARSRGRLLRLRLESLEDRNLLTVALTPAQ